MIKKVPNNFFDIIFYKDYNDDGAFPETIRNSFKIKKFYNSLNFEIQKGEKILIISTSSIFSFVVCLTSKLKGGVVYLSPLAQLHPFLDTDNPFEFGDKFENKGWVLNNEKGRRLSGKRTFKSIFRFFYRKLWKNIFVRLMFWISDGVLVLSNYEGTLVKKINHKIDLFRLDQWYYIPYKREGIKLDLPKNKINLLYWGRVDFYYKGLDVLIKNLHKLPNINLYISGGDYRNGMQKIKDFQNKENLTNLIYIKETISYKALQDFEYMILASRWEAFFRAPLDAIANDLKVLCRSSLNFDFYLRKKDILFNNDQDLIKILTKLNNEYNQLNYKE
jgi:hypothetical protein